MSVGHVIVMRDDLLLVVLPETSAATIDDMRGSLDAVAKEYGVKMLFLGGVDASDLRDAPPGVNDAARAVVEWLDR